MEIALGLTGLSFTLLGVILAYIWRSNGRMQMRTMEMLERIAQMQERMDGRQVQMAQILERIDARQERVDERQVQMAQILERIDARQLEHTKALHAIMERVR